MSVTDGPAALPKAPLSDLSDGKRPRIWQKSSWWMRVMPSDRMMRSYRSTSRYYRLPTTPVVKWGTGKPHALANARQSASFWTLAAKCLPSG